MSHGFLAQTESKKLSAKADKAFRELKVQDEGRGIRISFSTNVLLSVGVWLLRGKRIIPAEIIPSALTPPGHHETIHTCLTSVPQAPGNIFLLLYHDITSSTIKPLDSGQGL